MDRQVSAPQFDRLRVLLVVEPSQTEALQHFYCDVLGFHVEFEQQDDAGARFVALRNDGSRIMLGEPGALGVVPRSVSTSVVMTLEHPSVTSLHAVLSRREGLSVGPLRTMGGAEHFALTDPCGHQIWMITYGLESR